VAKNSKRKRDGTRAAPPEAQGVARAASEPPPGPPWGSPLPEAPLVFLDLEMTGLDPKVDRIIEVCAQRVLGGEVVRVVHGLVRPEPFSFGGGAIHGISERELATAPTFAERWPELEALFEGAVLVAHGAKWDVAFLTAELERAFPGARPPPFLEHYLDTVPLSRRAALRKSHALASWAVDLGLDVSSLHRALPDVLALRALFDRVSTELGARSPRDLWHVRAGEGHARPEVLAALGEALASGAPVTLRYRPARRGAEELPFVVTALLSDLDPPRVLGYLRDSRARRELRADRILAVAPLPPGPRSPRSQG
jgi:DNA polymerase-3 subunit epsilon